MRIVTPDGEGTVKAYRNRPAGQEVLVQLVVSHELGWYEPARFSLDRMRIESGAFIEPADESEVPSIVRA